MAPAVTSDTSPCARASHLHAETVSTLSQTANCAGLCDPESILEVESVMSTARSEGTISLNSAVTGVPSCVLSTGSQVVVSPVAVDVLSKTTMDFTGSGIVIPEPVNGIPAPSVASMVTSSARIVNVKDSQQRTFNMIIKNNNGKCGAGVLEANQLGELSRTEGLLQAICNGENASAPASDSQLSLVSSGQPMQASSIILTRPASSNRPFLHRMVIIPKTLSVIPSDVSDKGSRNEIKTVDCTDLPNVNAENVTGETSTSISSSAKVENICIRQKVLKSRVDRLLSRLRRLQTREANSFVKKQLTELVSNIRGTKYGLPVIDGAGDSKMLSLNTMSDYRNLSTSQLVGLVQRLQSADSVMRPFTEKAPSNVLCLDNSIRSELHSTAGRLRTNLRHLEQAVDSDATESSSGGESDEEMSNESISSDSSSSSPVYESNDQIRAQLAWSSERAMIASRWTWLQAQVSDIEYKIRQQSDIYRQLRQLKGAAVSYRSCQADVTMPTMSAAGQKSWTDNGGSDVRSDCGSNSETASSSDAEKSSAVNYDATCRAARCSAVLSLRHRRLLRSVTTILQAANQRKAVAPSTVRCTACYPPATPCALCSGRLNHVLRVGSRQSIHERIALLDPAFHPVLSFPQDVLLSTRLAECVRSGATCSSNSTNVEQSEAFPTACTSKGLTVRISKAHLKSLTVQTAGPGNHADSDVKRGVSSRDLLSSSYHGTRLVSSNEDSSSQASTKIYQGQHSTKRAFDTFRRKKRLGLANKRLGRSATMTSLKPVGRPPRLSQSASSASLKDALRRHSSASTSRTVFDINNVILPYNASASAARLEILQYKEIDTPKWRELRVDELSEELQHLITTKSVPLKRRKRNSCNLMESVLRDDYVGFNDTPAEQECSPATTAPRNLSLDALGVETDQETDSEVEDMSDEAFSSRHLRYEIYEKKQFFPATGQHRRSHSNRSESDHSTLPHARSPEPTPTLDFTCEPRPVLSHSSEAMLYQHESVSPSAVPFDGRIRCNSSSSSAVARTSFSFDPLTVSRFAEPFNASEVVAAATRSWPPRSFPLDDSDVEQLHDNRSNARRHSASSNRHSLTVTGPCSLPSMSSTHTLSTVGCPSDPAWTVATRPVRDEGCNVPMSTFVIKITKV